MRLLDHLYAVKNIISAGPSSDDFSYSNALIAHFLEVTRALLTEQKADKYRYISDQSFQSVCLSLALSNSHNCCEGPTDDCKVLRSTIKIPKFLNTRWGSFTKVTDLRGNVIPELNKTQNRLSKYSRQKNNSAGWYIQDGYIYILNNTDLEMILVHGLFDKPTEIEQINCKTTATSASCPNPFETEFPVDPDLVVPMYNLTLDYLLRSRGLPRDEENDARDIQVLSK
jgi:hypothetical protein